MVLTFERHSSRHHGPSTRDPLAFPTQQLALLALVRVAEPIALTSILPYAWKLVLSFHDGKEQDASFYTGILIASFAFAESLVCMCWGSMSDRYGRKPILLCGCAGTIASLLCVGFSKSFAMAIIGRALGGSLNGNIGVIQTMVGELVKNPDHEPKAFAIMPMMWAVGATLGPAVGGYFSQPSDNFPSLFPSDGLFGRYPFLLPNVICSALLLVAIILGALFIEETHPDKQPQIKGGEVAPPPAERPLVHTQASMETCPADISHHSYGTFNTIEVSEQDRWTVDQRGHDMTPTQPRVFSKDIVMLLIALGIFTYHCMTYDVLLPMFLQDERGGADLQISTISNAASGGLGMSTKQTGSILFFNGIIALLVQAIVFPAACSCFGVWNVFIIVTLGHPLAYLIVPSWTFIPQRFLYPSIYACLTIRNIFSILAYPALLILLKAATPCQSQLGFVNGMASSLGAMARMVASPASGYLYGVGITMDFTPLAWWASGLVALVGAIQVLFMHRQKSRATVHSLVHHMSRESIRSVHMGKHGGEVVHITVQETIHEEGEPDSEDEY